MKFVVTRTSSYGDKKPCKEAHLEKVFRLDFRTVPTIEEAKKYHWFEGWFSRGRNHREEKGMIVCDVECEEWVVSMIKLARLVEFVEKYGEIIISAGIYKGIMEIEIYDSYRE